MGDDDSLCIYCPGFGRVVYRKELILKFLHCSIACWRGLEGRIMN